MVVAAAAFTPSWSVVVLILGLTLGLTAAGLVFAGLLVVTHNADMHTSVWAAATLIGAASVAALSFFALTGRRRRNLRRALACLLEPDTAGAQR
ncbi:hypothetical protein ACFXO9_31345 [Nocardia tengchongensis]|uniref:hypothetical protein n=1 Tax=Nocardia tengchongensis TaxID=2055889 RepID=UPI0036824581